MTLVARFTRTISLQRKNEMSLVQRTMPTRTSFYSLLALLAWSPRVAAGQLRSDSTWRALQRLGGDVWSVWSAPAHAKTRDAEGVAAVARLTGAAAAVDEQRRQWLGADRG